ncbi:MAG: hypothetical protein UU64_C0002G0011 [candidate division WWE3 bacterium GW2011_GWF2_41_45]|nr:MAG: hypothetical protein UU55_C0001G0107 [candidate division WWE3 bacterium GW2011_GWC2_41_23]KKS10609.1 MAG: hypothetical protein UU64_C0002G0011 [candidate division WWE3 bacterium GW2011_GWF2_41_45]KKS12380.1 MAG: hypothetical protein UU68_C0002G0106 [candidate division WWE3 bacterium GW2011_GWF1_41_53]KKS20454.1 MAG: hypothetical protein UU79_C0001G0108 [candidate division WWE3 bacterium GW2011_GWE1_41_72]KKS28568.1 MAG: hypothetical protein UU90_C0023G0004 [candidate division WWE3 bacte
MFGNLTFERLLRTHGILLVSVQYTESEKPGEMHKCAQPVEYAVGDGGLHQLPLRVRDEIIKALHLRDCEAEVIRLGGTLYVKILK